MTDPKVRKWRRGLERVGVDLIDPTRVVLGCRVCDQRWSPEIQTGGGFRRGYRRCPNDCNAGRLSHG